MQISCFDDLLLAASQQPQGQRLLLVFASAELPEEATPAQRADFAQGHGGALVPAMCVDQTPDEIGNFERLVQEANQFGTAWQVVFVSTLSGQGSEPPSSKTAEPVLQRMVEAIKLGTLANMIAFDTSGQAIDLV
ncbi:MAG: ribonucleotide reductase subunit alpha [Rhodoferax sp.]|nr:ribonucleotide reductase subunit alpha [Rhodoferax sp.]